jgi:hypothetical protein
VKYVVEIKSGVLHTKFRKEWFRHSKLNREGFTDTQHDDLILRLFFSK